MFNKLRANLSKVGQTRSETFTTSPQEEFIPSGVENVINNTNFMGIQAQNNPNPRDIQNTVGNVVGVIQKEVEKFENIRRGNEIEKYKSELAGKWLDYEQYVFDNPAIDADAYLKQLEQKGSEFLTDIKNDYIKNHGIEKGTFLYNNYFEGIGLGANARFFAEAEKVRRQKIILEGQISAVQFRKEHDNSIGNTILANKFKSLGADGFLSYEEFIKEKYRQHWILNSGDKQFIAKYDLQEEMNNISNKFNKIRLINGAGVEELVNPDGSTSPDYDKITKVYKEKIRELKLKIKPQSSIHKEVMNPVGKYVKQKWLKRVFTNPNKNIKIIENGKEKFASVKTMSIDVDIDNDGTLDVVLIPTIREIDGKLVQLSDEEAQRIALEKKDYILFNESKNAKENRSSADKFSKQISDGIEIARENSKGKTIKIGGVNINVTEVDNFIIEAEELAEKQHKKNKDYTNRVNDNVESNAYNQINIIKAKNGVITAKQLDSILYDSNGEPVLKGKNAEKITREIIAAALRPSVEYDTEINDVATTNLIIRNKLNSPHVKYVLPDDVDDPMTGIDESKVGYSLTERENHPDSRVGISSKVVNQWYESGSNRSGKKTFRENEQTFNSKWEALINSALSRGMLYKADGSGVYSTSNYYVGSYIEELRNKYYKKYIEKINSGISIDDLNNPLSKEYFFDKNNPPEGIFEDGLFPSRSVIAKIKKDGRAKDRENDAKRRKKKAEKNKNVINPVKRNPGETIEDFLKRTKGTP